MNLGELGWRIGPDIWVNGPVDIASDAQLIGPYYWVKHQDQPRRHRPRAGDRS